MADSDLLNEEEIDALTSDDDGAAYRPFDFTSRERTLLGQFTALAGINERHADGLGRALADTFSLDFTVDAQSLQLSSYGDLAMATEPTLGLATLDIAPLGGPCHVLMPPELLSLLVNQYFGGGRNALPAQQSRSSLTPSELRLAERLAGLVGEAMAAAWADKLALRPGEPTVVMHPDRLESVPARDVALLLAFDLAVGDWRSSLRVVIPFALLEPHRQRFAPPRRGAEEGPGWEPYLRRELLQVPVEVSGVLCSRELPLAELLTLRIGSVLPIEVPAEAELRVEGEAFAAGKYGSHDGRKAVKLTRLALAGAAAERKDG